MFGLDPTLTFLLIACLTAACAFEFINGFHDTANAVATVIYTNSLKPWIAVIWSAVCNSVGVFAGGITVAMGISYLIPMEVLADPNIYHSVALIMALLLTAIIWNLGTWYYGIPCSSSHTLVGSILGVGLAYSFIAEKSGNYVNWSKAGDIGLSLLVSPIIGFGLTIMLMYILRLSVKNKSIFKAPKTNDPPPFAIRMVLLLTCTGVSYSHGSNDGQKGVGLVMLILIAIAPSYFAINSKVDLQKVKHEITVIDAIINKTIVTQITKEDSLEFNELDINFLDVNYLEDLLNVLDALAIAEDEDVLAQSTSTQITGTLLGKDPDTQITALITGNVISLRRSVNESVRLDLDGSESYTVIFIQDGISNIIKVNGGSDSVITITQSD